MSQLFLFLSTMLVLLFGGNTVPNEAIKSAFNKNDAKALIEMADDKVLMNILGSEAAYSKSQGEQVLKKYFSENAGGQFDYLFKGKENDAGAFSIGEYKTRARVHRVIIQFKIVKNQHRIGNISIE
jgi:hypothetical protein